MLESVWCGHKWSEHYSQFLSNVNILDNTLEPEESPSAGHKKEYEFKALRFLWTGNLRLS